MWQDPKLLAEYPEEIVKIFGNTQQLNPGLREIIEATFVIQNTPQAKYSIGDEITINWTGGDIQQWFLQLYEWNRWKAADAMRTYAAHDKWRITDSQILTNFRGKEEVCYNIIPLDDLDGDYYFLYFIPEQFIGTVNC